MPGRLPLLGRSCTLTEGGFSPRRHLASRLVQSEYTTRTYPQMLATLGKRIVITRRKIVIALGVGAFAPLAAFAQQSPAKVARIGYLSPSSASGHARLVEALRAGLRDLGYVEG